jgi:hypothetical protein
VLAFFKQSGRGYQSRINAVLRAFVDAQRRKGKAADLLAMPGDKDTDLEVLRGRHLARPAKFS